MCIYLYVVKRKITIILNNVYVHILSLTVEFDLSHKSLMMSVEKNF